MRKAWASVCVMPTVGALSQVLTYGGTPGHELGAEALGSQCSSPICAGHGHLSSGLLPDSSLELHGTATTEGDRKEHQSWPEALVSGSCRMLGPSASCYGRQTLLLGLLEQNYARGIGMTKIRNIKLF